MADYVSAVREFVVENFLYGDGSRLEENTSFLDHGIIDSTGLLELVGFLEQRFEIHVEDEELVPENMNSLACISSYIDRKLNSKPAL